jgi:hypothetical protein
VIAATSPSLVLLEVGNASVAVSRSWSFQIVKAFLQCRQRTYDLSSSQANWSSRAKLWSKIASRIGHVGKDPDACRAGGACTEGRIWSRTDTVLTFGVASFLHRTDMATISERHHRSNCGNNSPAVVLFSTGRCSTRLDTCMECLRPPWSNITSELLTGCLPTIADSFFAALEAHILFTARVLGTIGLAYTVGSQEHKAV